MFNKTGVTLVEILIASAIAIIVTTVALTFYLMTCNACMDSSKRAPLQRKAGLAMEKMVRGINGKDGIREADGVTIFGDTKIEYTSGIDAQERSFYLSGSEMIYDPDTSISNNEFSIIGKVITSDDHPIFSLTDSIVTINLDMQDKIRDTDINISLSTRVMIRN